MATLCLNMIVRNEAHVITRCLASLRPLLDYWVIVDTGSDDGTQDIIREFMKDIPGELHERPWVNFCHNRNEALVLARSKADYLFIIDADETVSTDPGFSLSGLRGDAYMVDIHYHGLRYQRPQLVRSDLPWRYEGVLHEYLTCSHATIEVLTGIRIECHPDGARSRDPEKFRKDAAVLEQALKETPGNERYAFYLAQSYRDAGDRGRAIEAYRKRASMGGWNQEVWYSLYQIGRLIEMNGAPWAETQHAYLEAYTFRPSRIEPMYHIVRHFNRAEIFDTAWCFAKATQPLASPADTLFVEEHVYAFLFPMEFAICAFHQHDHECVLQMTGRVIGAPNAPAHLKRQAEQTRKRSLALLSEK